MAFFVVTVRILRSRAPQLDNVLCKFSLSKCYFSPCLLSNILEPMSLLIQCFADLQVNYHFFFTQLRQVLMDYPQLCCLKCLFIPHYSNRNSLHESISAAFLTARAFFISNIYLSHNGNLNIC